MLAEAKIKRPMRGEKPLAGRPRVYLAYLDDSDTKQKARKYQVLSGVIIPDEFFIDAEMAMGIQIADLIPPGKIDEFEEFHACELFGGYESFQDIDQYTRLNAIRCLLEIISDAEFPVVYGAVDLEKLRTHLYGSANPTDIAFRICAEGIEKWIVDHPPALHDSNYLSNFALLIADECDRDTKLAMRKTFRSLRKQLRPPHYETGAFEHVHDEMYFGDSKESIGIQLADLCSYIIGRHLEGDPAVEGFYEIIEKQIVYGKVEPKDEGEK